MNSYQKLKSKLEARIAVLEKEKSILIKEPESIYAHEIKTKFLIFDSEPNSMRLLRDKEKKLSKSKFNQYFPLTEKDFFKPENK